MSRTLLEPAFFAYLFAFGCYAVGLLSAKRLWRVLGPLALGVGLLVQATALLARWVDAGEAELAAMQGALGHPLHGLAWLRTAAGHPPYTNFYESLLCLSFLLLLVYFVSERRWRVPGLGCVAVGLGLLLLGRALLVPNPAIEPLEPALQSFWILLHVSVLLVAYACFMVGCALGLALLFKVETPSSEVGAFLTAAAVPVVLLAGGARSLFGRLTFQLTPVGLNALGLPTPLQFVPTGADKAQRVLVDVPWVGLLLLLAAALYLGAAFFYLRSARSGEGEVGPHHLAYWTTLAATASLATAVAIVFATFWFTGPVTLPPLAGQVERDLAGPYHFALAGSPDAVGVLLLTLLCCLAFLGITRFRDRLVLDLPEVGQLDDAIFRLVAVGFPLLTGGIVMGGMWAHLTWGRYWGWDPKETWALITWLVYAIYLHARLSLGWAGKPGAWIAVGGFAVVLFCYLGVNLGLAGQVLHTYGAG